MQSLCFHIQKIQTEISPSYIQFTLPHSFNNKSLQCSLKSFMHILQHCQWYFLLLHSESFGKSPSAWRISPTFYVTSPAIADVFIARCPRVKFAWARNSNEEVNQAAVNCSVVECVCSSCVQASLTFDWSEPLSLWRCPREEDREYGG